MIVFDKDWFKENQRTLLGLVNSPIGGTIRRGLWISDRQRIIKLTPSSAHAALSNGEIKATLYSNAQYAEALKRNYKPIWEALHWWDMRLANRLMPAWNAGFDTYSSQPNSSAGHDIYLDSSSPTTNLDGGGFCMGEINVGSAKARALIKFDVSSISPSAVINSVNFYITVDVAYSSISRTYRFYRSLRNWVETQATWNDYSTGNAWATGGSGNSTTDYSGAVTHGSVSMTASEAPGTQKNISMNATEFGKWVDGTNPNYGWFGKADTENEDFYNFCDCENATPSYRPKVEAVYSVRNLRAYII